MKLISATHVAVGAILNVLDLNETELPTDNMKAAISDLQSYINPEFLQEQITKKPEPLNETATREEMLRATYEVIQGESKPGPTLVHKELGVSLGIARGLLKEVTELGWLEKAPTFEDSKAPSHVAESVAETKESETKEAEKVEPADKTLTNENKRPITELIDQLPQGGDNVLLPSPYKELVALPEKQRAVYLAGLKLEDLITTEMVVAANQTGVNRMLIDQVIKLSGRERPSPPADSLVDATTHEKTIMEFTNAVENGAEIFNLLSLKGLTKAVLIHMDMIKGAA